MEDEVESVARRKGCENRGKKYESADSNKLRVINGTFRPFKYFFIGAGTVQKKLSGDRHQVIVKHLIQVLAPAELG